MMPRGLNATGVMGLLVAVATGCGGSGPPLVDAGGTVTYQGKPVAGASVTFVPNLSDGERITGKKTPMAIGKTDEDGRFRLFTGDRRGVVVADMKVSITAFPPVDVSSVEAEFTTDKDGNPIDFSDPQARNKMMRKMMSMSIRSGRDDGGAATTDKSLIPMKYGAFLTSGLTAVVAEDSDNEFPFDLE